MKYKVKAFGVTQDILGAHENTLEVSGQTVADLRKSLEEKYPALIGLRSLLIAVNQNYAEDHTRLQETDEIVLIPPVSGG